MNIVFFKRYFDRLKRYLQSDSFILDPFGLLFRTFKMIFYLIIDKSVIFLVRGNHTTFKYIFKPYKSLGFGGRGQYVYRQNYDRFFVIDLNLFNKKIDTFFDIGCSRGFFSTYMSKAFSCKTLSIDLYEYAINDCEENMKLNNLSNYFIERAAIGSPDDIGKTVEIKKGSVPSRTSILEASFLGEKSNNSIVIKSIDQLMEDQNYSTLDFIKLDVEGYELQVLEGARNTIKKYNPIIYLEFNQMRSKIIKLSNSMGYIALMPTRKKKLRKLSENNLNKCNYENVFLVSKIDAEKIDPKNIF